MPSFILPAPWGFISALSSRLGFPGAPLKLLGLCSALVVFGVVSELRAQPAGPPPGARGPLEVGVLEVKTEKTPFSVTLAGRAVAFEQVEVRPRVSGVVSEILYEPGKRVAVGAPLFKIEDATYAAQVASAEADVQSARAELAFADSKLRRYKKIESTGVTGADVEEATASELKAKAALSVAEAALRIAKLELERTVIRSDIQGRPDVPTVSVGDIVTANQTDALAIVTRVDPIYIDAQESSARLIRIRNRFETGALKRISKVVARVHLEDGRLYDVAGEVVSPGLTVSTSTGTTIFRMKFDNPTGQILPGQFLRVDVTIGEVEAILAPQGATRRGVDGELYAFVAREGKAVRVALTSAGSHQNAWIVTRGLQDGDQLIVDNLRNLRDGAAVKPVSAAPKQAEAR